MTDREYSENPEFSPTSPDVMPIIESEELSPLAAAFQDFDQANANMLRIAQELARRQDTPEADTLSDDMEARAADVMDGLEKLIAEVCAKQATSDEAISLIKEIIKRSDKDRVDLFISLTGYDDLFKPIDDVDVDTALHQAFQQYGLSHQFASSVRGSYSNWLGYDLDALKGCVVPFDPNEGEKPAGIEIHESSENLAAQMTEDFFADYAKRVALWKDFDINNADHRKLMNRKLTIDTNKRLAERGVLIGGIITISGASVGYNGGNFVRINSELSAAGVLAGFGIGEVYTYDSEANKPIVLQEMGLYLAIERPLTSDEDGTHVDISHALPSSLLSLPITQPNATLHYQPTNN